jgi:hypothetical protein
VALSGTDQVLQLGPGRMDASLLINVQSIEIASGDELYAFMLEGSDDSAFGSGIEVLGYIQLGKGNTANRIGNADVDSVVGLYELPFTNERAGTIYDYVRLNVVIAGTIAVGIKFDSWIAPHSDGG